MENDKPDGLTAGELTAGRIGMSLANRIAPLILGALPKTTGARRTFLVGLLGGICGQAERAMGTAEVTFCVNMLANTANEDPKK